MFKVYWTDAGNVTRSAMFDNMATALECTKQCRDNGDTFVSMVSENPNCVGKMGVSAVENGKTPDGHDYTWMKRRTQ